MLDCWIVWSVGGLCIVHITDLLYASLFSFSFHAMLSSGTDNWIKNICQLHKIFKQLQLWSDFFYYYIFQKQTKVSSAQTILSLLIINIASIYDSNIKVTFVDVA